eukprot:COSAG02_NODE_27568_length_606_cov_2.370809_2_plen_94_part_01
MDGPLVPPESCLPSTLDLIAGSVRRWFPSIRHMPAIELAARLAAVHAGAGGAIETTIEPDKRGGFGTLPLPLIVLCGGFPRNFVSDLESAHLSG